MTELNVVVYRVCLASNAIGSVSSEQSTNVLAFYETMHLWCVYSAPEIALPSLPDSFECLDLFLVTYQDS